jgi:hypothetical protein
MSAGNAATGTVSSALRSWPGRVGVVTALAVGAGSLTLLPGGSSAYAAGLVAWEDCDELLGHYRTELARTASPYGIGIGGGGGVLMAEDNAGGAGGAGTDMAVAAQAPAAAESTSSRTSGAVGTGPTGTNLQEAGVDEPDTAKLRDDLLVAVAAGRLQVVRTGAQPQVLSSVPLGDGVGGGELLVDGDRVLVVGTGWRGGPEPMPLPEPLPEPPPDEPAPDVPLPDEPLPDEPAPDQPLPEPVPIDPIPIEPGPGDDTPPDDVPTEDPGVPDVTAPTGDVVTEPDTPTSSEEEAKAEAQAAEEAEDADRAQAAQDIAVAPGGGRAIDISMPAGEQLVRLVLVDVADAEKPAVLETLEIDGRYVSARLVDGTVRLVTSSWPQVQADAPAEPYGPDQEKASLEKNREAAESAGVEEVLPQAVRYLPSGEEVAAGPAVECAAVQHAESSPTGSSTLLVTTLRPAQGLAAVDSTAVTTDGDLVYASPDRLYVATSRWGTVAPMGGDAVVRQDGDVTTEVHAFDTTSPSGTPYVGSGSVNGYLYGRWALSEHEGVLRVATTLAPPWGGDENVSSSLVTLAEEGDRLVERGRLDGLGPSERIYAVRYFGDLATVVTFRQTDPLYVLDLADAARPRLLGELKIPGFSTYLHPIGDDRLLGVGQDATEDGRVTGFQISLFDLSDPAAPKQVDRLSLGEGYSPASDDSRAFGYDPERRLAVLPFATWDPRTGIDRPSALAVRVDGDRLVEAGRLAAPAGSSVDRVLLGGDRAYAVTWGGVLAADLPSMTQTGSAAFEGLEPVSSSGGGSSGSSSGSAGSSDVVTVQPAPAPAG